MNQASARKSWSERTKSWMIRYIKFNLIGGFVFLIGTAIYGTAFPTFGAWTWLIANAAGSVLQFGLITYFNKKKIGMIFDQCLESKKQKTVL